MGSAANSGVAIDVTPAAMAAAKLGMIDKLLVAIEKQPSLSKTRDGEGKSRLFRTKRGVARFKGV